jgi:hypothetical protein
MTTTRPPLTRFMAKVDTSAGWGKCWPWTGARDRQGYAVFTVSGVKSIRGGRWLLGHLRGRPLRRDEFACHHCDNPPCVNPTHLYVGDYATNQVDAVHRGRHHNAAKTHCKNGHEYTGETTYIVPSTGHRQCRRCQRENWKQPTSEERHERYLRTGT